MHRAVGGFDPHGVVNEGGHRFDVAVGGLVVAVAGGGGSEGAGFAGELGDGEVGGVLAAVEEERAANGDGVGRYIEVVQYNSDGPATPRWMACR